jgi:hypothetical protein
VTLELDDVGVSESALYLSSGAKISDKDTEHAPLLGWHWYEYVWFRDDTTHEEDPQACAEGPEVDPRQDAVFRNEHAFHSHIAP